MNKCCTIGIVNKKGGVGKTTTALCLADELRARGARVLLVDLDQQHNATKQFGAEIDGQTTSYDLFTDPDVKTKEAIQHTEAGDVVAGDSLNNKVDLELAHVLIGRESRIRNALEQIKSSYDFIVLDCSPTLGLSTLNAMVASDRLIIPMLADGYSVDALFDVVKLVEQVQASINPELQIAGLLVTQYEGNQKLARAYNQQLPDIAANHGFGVFETKIRRCCKVKEAQIKAQPLRNFAPRCTAALDYAALADELLSLNLI